MTAAKHAEGILPKGPYLPCVSMAGRALLAGYLSDLNLTTDIPYPTLTGELLAVYCEDLGENWPCYNGTALYLFILHSQYHDCRCPGDARIQVISSYDIALQGHIPGA